jgi:hypothetical protein
VSERAIRARGKRTIVDKLGQPQIGKVRSGQVGAGRDGTGQGQARTGQGGGVPDYLSMKHGIVFREHGWMPPIHISWHGTMIVGGPRPRPQP